MSEALIQERLKLIEAFLNKVPTSKCKLPSLFISGVSRSGKSQLAKVISERTGLEIVYLDPIREFYYDIPDYVCRHAVKKIFYRKLLTKCPTGYIFEGYDSVVRNQSWSGGDTDISMSLYNELQLTYDFKVLLVGYADAHVEEKILGIKKWHLSGGHKCYLNGKDISFQRRIVEQYIHVSKAIRDKAKKRYLYMEINDHAFENNFNDAYAKVMPLLYPFTILTYELSPDFASARTQIAPAAPQKAPTDTAPLIKTKPEHFDVQHAKDLSFIDQYPELSMNRPGASGAKNAD